MTIIVIIHDIGNPIHIPLDPIILYNATTVNNGIASVKRTEIIDEKTGLSIAS